MTGRDAATARVIILQMYQHPYRPISKELRDRLLAEIGREAE